MNRAAILFGLIVLGCALMMGQPAQPVPGIHLPSDDEIRALLAERVKGLDGDGDDIGMIVGIITPEGRRFI